MAFPDLLRLVDRVEVLFFWGVFCFYNVVGSLDEGVDLGVGDVAVEVELYPVSKALIERVAHR
mgnify:CR=1 FL=1